MPQYLLLLHEDPSAYRTLAPAEMQAIIERYAAWRTQLQQQGTLVGANKLRDDEGRQLRKQNGQPMVTDGPYSELKEVIGGYFLVTADSYDAATDLAKGCPHIDFGTIEVREVQEMRR
jgi:hypothetical protein